MKQLHKRLLACTLSALPKAKKTSWWLLKLIIPISLVVSLLQHWGIIAQMAVLLEPLFSFIGLPGESAIVFISSIFLPLYAPIAIIATLPLGMREITILALMCLISHNMIVETAIQKKTGSSAPAMFFTRLITSFVAAYVLHLLLPQSLGKSLVAEQAVVFDSISELLINWAQGAAWLVVKITLIITGLMILQNILKEFNILNYLSKTFAPLMKIFGLSKESSFLWFVGQILGLTYGSAVMIEEVENKEITPRDANLLNYHIAINHSLLEDTLLFIAIGVPGFWIIAPRFLFAIAIVWGVRAIMLLRKKPFTLKLKTAPQRVAKK